MLAQNNFSKYLIYAIGEIILVVIGILIALAINNWNTESNNQVKEKEALSEIFQALKSDNQQLIEINNQEREVIRMIDSLNLEFQNRGSFANDSLQVYLGKALVGQRPTFVTTPYDVLISSGIGLIRDKDIRYDIAKYYGRSLPELENDGNDLFQQWYDAILPIIQKEADYWVLGKILVPYSIDSVFKNNELFQLLKVNKDNHYQMELNSQKMILENQELIKKIESEIQK
ncbi:hypothetical protein SAMN03097699_1839 [Flavobacteriaceae bacterium MAR_2010_188]|nr:hypothetical protein SAMN03097699_1839 [Flavobacteriaceae bacterium MAR_2010_188]